MKSLSLEILKLIVDTSVDGRFVIIDFPEFFPMFDKEEFSKEKLDLIAKDLEINDYIEIKFINDESLCAKPKKKGFGIIEGYKRNIDVKADSLLETHQEKIKMNNKLALFIMMIFGSFIGGVLAITLYVLLKKYFKI